MRAGGERAEPTTVKDEWLDGVRGRAGCELEHATDHDQMVPAVEHSVDTAVDPGECVIDAGSSGAWVPIHSREPVGPRGRKRAGQRAVLTSEDVDAEVPRFPDRRPGAR